uniref:Uncharacterized protein n=1 Tax=Romanomermis culicivorax TaxID=13658 RepID=A0A915HKW2_ROMCU
MPYSKCTTLWQKAKNFFLLNGFHEYQTFEIITIPQDITIDRATITSCSLKISHISENQSDPLHPGHGRALWHY